LVEGDVTDSDSLARIFSAIKADEVYNLAAASFVGSSFSNPYYVSLVNAIGAVNVMTAAYRANHNVKIYQASSSEQFGNEPSPQNEYSRFSPRSPYGVSKAFAHQMAHVLRDSQQMNVWCGIMFNHESPRRGEEFLSRKVAIYVAGYVAGRTEQKLKLGYVSSKRDWGFSGDYVKAMHLMLQEEQPHDYVVATGVAHSVQELVETAFACAGIEPTGLIEIDEALMRRNEVSDLRGDSRSIRQRLGWAPEVDFEHLIKMMVESEIARTLRALRP
jgi:GDPmannose 4,6-dehydratase